MKEKVVRFNCPSCGERVSMQGGAITDEGTMVLFGTSHCGEKVIINLDTLITKLMTDVPGTNEC